MSDDHAQSGYLKLNNVILAKNDFISATFHDNEDELRCIEIRFKQRGRFRDTIRTLLIKAKDRTLHEVVGIGVAWESLQKQL